MSSVLIKAAQKVQVTWDPRHGVGSMDRDVERGQHESDNDTGNGVCEPSSVASPYCPPAEPS